MTKDKQSHSEKRAAPRAEIRMRVDYELKSKDTFLFEYTTNMSRDGIFLSTKNPLQPGTKIHMRFAIPEVKQVIEVEGKVSWINPYRPGGKNLNPGMGVQFLNLKEKDKQIITNYIKRKALLQD